MEESWEDWIADWQISLEGGTLSPETWRVYLRGARQFTDWLPGDIGPGEVTRRDVERWLAHLRESGKGESTRRVRLMTLRVLFAWLADEPGSGVAPPLPTDKIDAPMPELPRARIPDDADLSKLLATCRDKNNFADLRDAAIIRLMLSCGLRRGEVVSIDIGRFDPRSGEVGVLGKGGKRRTVAVAGETHLALNRYRRVRARRAVEDESAFFVSIVNGRRLTGGALAEMLDRRCETAGIPSINPHALRHWWAHSAKKAGMSDEVVENIGGWSTPGMARRYGRELADRRALDALRQQRLGDDL